jgi:ABC-type dipeptide/oligopeptide/nickel transport system permease subunit
MRPAKPKSTGALMVVILVLACELALFQDVWSIVVIPSITMALLAMNLGFVFLMLRPPALENRIIGMLLGGFAAWIATVLGMIPAFGGKLDQLRDSLANWASALPDQQGPTVAFFRLAADFLFFVYFALLDVLGVALILAGGWLDSRWRSRRARARAAVPPLDGRASSPL